ncbi:MAG TPA: AAA family ATPase, partial [Chitinophagales bacterium]|nr:AAA family ATPase [Chitinophagales bacterium]
AKARYTELRSVEQFRNNLTRETRLYSVELANLPFYGSFTWHLRSSMNIMLGKNGYGKSHLMSIILALLQEEEKLLRGLTLLDRAAPTPVPYLKVNLESNHEKDSETLKGLNNQLEEKSRLRAEYLGRLRTENKSTANASGEMMAPVVTEWDSDIIKLQRQLELLSGIAYFDKLGIQSSYGKIPVLAIPDSRFINKSVESTSSRNDDRSKKILENGAYQFMLQVPYEDAIQNLLNTVSTIYLDERSFEDEIFQLIRRVFKRLTGQEFAWESIQRTEDNSGFIIKVMTEGSDTPLPIQKVSQGTLSVISMIGMMYHYLSLRYPSVPRKQVIKQPAIIVIDEIDAHLHPSWQQKIIGILRNEFPNVQFIISAHSPLVVAGCKEEEVSVLRKREKGFTMETIESNLIGKPIADIFRMIFEIEEKDEMYLQLAALIPFKKSIKTKAETLRAKSTRTEKEEEQLQELEQQIQNFIYLEQFDAIRSTYDEMEELKHANGALQLEVEKLKAEMSKVKN